MRKNLTQIFAQVVKAIVLYHPPEVRGHDNSSLNQNSLELMEEKMKDWAKEPGLANL